MSERTIPLQDQTIQRLSIHKIDVNESYDDLVNRLLDEMEEDLNAGDLEEIQKGLCDIANGRVVSQEELLKKYGVRP